MSLVSHGMQQGWGRHGWRGDLREKKTCKEKKKYLEQRSVGRSGITSIGLELGN